MSSILSLIMDNLGWIVLAVGGLIGAVFARKAGADAERARRAREEQRARNIANEQDSMIDAMPSDEAREELKRHWTRK